MNGMFTAYYESPLGILKINGTDNSITAIDFLEGKETGKENKNNYLEYCLNQLDEYFRLKREIFDLRLQPDGSVFQEKVWDQLMKIPFGKTLSYIEFALKLGDAKTIRAAAKANSKNKIAIVIPCHRVIGADGSLVGYAGGLWRKKWLIEHESKKYGEQLYFNI